MCFELILRQVTFDPIALDALRIQDQDGRGPARIEPMEPCRMFLDMGFDREEIRVDEGRDTVIRVRLGFQPSACPSSRRRAEIE